MKNQHGTAWRVGFLVAMLSLLFAACVGEDEPENGEEGAESPVPDDTPPDVSDGTAPEDVYVPPDETQPE